MQSKLTQSLVFTLGLSLLFTSFLFAQSKQPPTQRWEYKTVYNVGEAELNKLGDEGWELVAYQPNSNSLYYTLKRLKPADAPKYVEPAKRPEPPPEAPSCNLSLAQAPAIRGLRLGMTLEELSELFPGVSLNELKLSVERDAGYPSFGNTNYGFRGGQHKDRLEENMRFEVNLFDGRVRGYRIYYRFNNQTSYGQIYSNEKMIDKLVESLKLPPKESWKSEYPGRIFLRCQGFQLVADFQGSVIISVDDASQTYVEKMKQRKQEDSAKKQVEFKP